MIQRAYFLENHLTHDQCHKSTYLNNDLGIVKNLEFVLVWNFKPLMRKFWFEFLINFEILTHLKVYLCKEWI